jgi:hypothetical protein
VLKDCSVKITQKPDTAASGPGLAVSCNPTLPKQGLVWRGIFVVSRFSRNRLAWWQFREIGKAYSKFSLEAFLLNPHSSPRYQLGVKDEHNR